MSHDSYRNTEQKLEGVIEKVDGDASYETCPHNLKFG